MKHQIGRMWDSKNCRWCQHHKIPIWVKVTWLLVLKNQFSLFRTQARISSCWRTHTHCQDEVVAERGQTNRSSGGQRPTLLDRRGHEEAGLAWGWGRSVYYCGRVCSYSTTIFAWITQDSTRMKVQTTRNRQVISLWKDLGARVLACILRGMSKVLFSSICVAFKGPNLIECLATTKTLLGTIPRDSDTQKLTSNFPKFLDFFS